MPLQLAGRGQQLLLINRTGQRLIQSQPGDGGGGAAAQSALHRNLALDFDVECRDGEAVARGQKTQPAFDVVLALKLHVGEVELQSLTRAGTHAQRQVELHGHGQRVKAGTDVRDGAWNLDDKFAVMSAHDWPPLFDSASDEIG